MARRRTKATAEVRRVVGYVRVSTTRQADEGHSLDAQRARLIAYCDLYDLELVSIQADEGASGSTTQGRAGLAEALRAVRSGEADGILAAKLDRLTRSQRDLADLLDESTASGWGLISVAEQLDTSTAAGRMVVSILGVVSQWQREDIGERTSATMQAMRDAGLYTGGKPRYGYRLVDGRLVEHPGEQLAIEGVVMLRRAGLSLRAVCRELEARGLLPRNGRRWAASSVLGIERDAADAAGVA